jgi:hypothetical protein
MAREARRDFFLGWCIALHAALPTAYQTAQFGREFGEVFILRFTPPVPFAGEQRILTQLVERNVSALNVHNATLLGGVARCDQRIVHLHGQRRYVFGHGVAVFSRKTAHGGEQPLKHLAGSGVYQQRAFFDV